MEWLTEHDEVTGEEYIAVDTRGEALLRDPSTNKGTALTETERADLGLDGLLPPAVSTMDQQLRRPAAIRCARSDDARDVPLAAPPRQKRYSTRTYTV